MKRALVVVSLILGCNISIPGKKLPVIDPNASATYSEHIEPLFARACVNCHRAGAIAPFALDSYAAAKTYGEAALDAVKTRRMPPFPIDGSGSCRSYQDIDFLSDAEVSQLSAWVTNGFAQGPTKPSTPAPTAVTFARPVSLAMAEPYTPQRSDKHPNDDYRCFLVPGLPTEQFVTGTQVLPGSPRVVHHVLVYELGDAASETKAQALDDASAGPGWTCFGGVGDAIDYTPIVLWAPGMPPSRFPANTGIKIAPNRRLVMEVHYNLANGVEADKSTVVLDTADDVRDQASFLTMDDGALKLPPGAKQTQHKLDMTIGEMFGDPKATFTVHSIGGHMHTLGSKMRVELDSTCLMSIPQWDFNWQRIATLKEPVTMTGAQRFRQVCEFDTTSRTKETPWGEGTEDEMCLSILYVTVPGHSRF